MLWIYVTEISLKSNCGSPTTVLLLIIVDFNKDLAEEEDLSSLRDSNRGLSLLVYTFVNF